MTRHPTILIGYGAYGLQVMRRFLASAAARGALAWDDGGVGSLNERKLRSLSLLWVRDTRQEESEAPQAGLLAETGYELMDDLNEQIEEISGTLEEVPAKLAEALEREKRRQLDTRNRTGVGLDVFILAQPNVDEVMGSLRGLLEPGMLRLYTDQAFKTVHEGGGDTLLNFIQIFDFDEYWAPAMEPVRSSLQQILQENQATFANDRPTIGRVYLFDGTTASGHRRYESRVQEVVLFLELLLLEGLRHEPDASVLYRRERLAVPPVCTIGVRVVERSSGLLRRLAAAAFARDWLGHIASGAPPDMGADPFEHLLQPFRSDAIGDTVGESQLLADARQQIDGVGRALFVLSVEDPDWDARLQETAAAQTETAIQRLSRLSGAQSERLGGGALKQFRETLDEAVISALQKPSSSWTLGAVIRELRRLEDEFVEAVSKPLPMVDDREGSQEIFGEAGRMQREYVMYRDRQVQAARLKVQWWPRAAIVFGLALSPLVVRAILETWTSNPLEPWMVALLSTLSTLLLGGAFWLAGRRLVHPALQRLTERAREFYTDTEQGRLAERVRRIIASPAVEGRITAYSHQLTYGLRQYVLGAVAADLKRARAMLLRRQEEVEWLRRQVDEFLRSHNVHVAPEGWPVFAQGRSHSEVRYSLERDDDLKAVAQSKPRGVDRYRELVTKDAIFTGWSQQFSDTFLHPLPFLDNLSDSFQDRLELNDTESRHRADRIATFLERDLEMEVCFLWQQADGLPGPVKRSLFPTVWNTLPNVRPALHTAGFGTHVMDTPNTERLYLFESILGVPTDLLVGAR